eukprot:05637_2
MVGQEPDQNGLCIWRKWRVTFAKRIEKDVAFAFRQACLSPIQGSEIGGWDRDNERTDWDGFVGFLIWAIGAAPATTRREASDESDQYSFVA